MPRDDYYQRQAERAERLEDRAERLTQEGAARAKRGWDDLRAIPFGQPMMPGHYSYNRDRNYRGRAIANIDKGGALQKEAGEVAARAANAAAMAAGDGPISSDAPDAIELLREKLAKMEATQAKMVAANKLVRKKDMAGLAALVGEANAAALFQPDFAGRIGFADYQLTNNSANMRRVKDRIAALEREAARQAEPPPPVEVNGVTMVENVDENRLQLIFPGKPPENVRSMLKSAGFRWSPREGAWQRQLNNGARYAGQRIMEAIK